MLVHQLRQVSSKSLAAVRAVATPAPEKPKVVIQHVPLDDGTGHWHFLCDPRWYLHVLLTPVRSVSGLRTIRDRRYIIDDSSWEIHTWNYLLGFLAVYTAVYSPLSLSLPLIRWDGDNTFAHFVDSCFCVDILIKLRTLYHDRGYAVVRPSLVMKQYIRTEFFWDTFGAFPLDHFVIWVTPSSAHKTIRWLGATMRLLRLRRCRRLMRQVDRKWNVSFMMVGMLIGSFLLLAHWFGLAFLSIAIEPIISSGDATNPWWWHKENPENYQAHLYVCGLYWALSVMTNLKTLPGVESRDCYYSNRLVTKPLAERTFTIFVFLVGALFFSSIYGNIQIFVARMNKINERFSHRMFEVNEFIQFHGLTATLAAKIRNYVEFSFLATKGINIDSISNQLPPYLQVQITLHLNKKLMESVKILAGCPRGFIQSLVFKLVPSICVVGDNIVSEGEVGDCLYFIRRGIAEVVAKHGMVVATLHEGDYFGEMALLWQEKRTADVRASTDCMLLSLSHDDLEDALGGYPHIRERIEAAAHERLQSLKKTDKDSKSKSGASNKLTGEERGAVAALIESPSTHGGVPLAKRSTSMPISAKMRRQVSTWSKMPKRVKPEDIDNGRQGASTPPPGMVARDNGEDLHKGEDPSRPGSDPASFTKGSGRSGAKSNREMLQEALPISFEEGNKILEASSRGSRRGSVGRMGPSMSPRAYRSAAIQQGLSGRRSQSDSVMGAQDDGAIEISEINQLNEPYTVNADGDKRDDGQNVMPMKPDESPDKRASDGSEPPSSRGEKKNARFEAALPLPRTNSTEAVVIAAPQQPPKTPERQRGKPFSVAGLLMKSKSKSKVLFETASPNKGEKPKASETDGGGSDNSVHQPTTSTKLTAYDPRGEMAVEPISADLPSIASRITVIEQSINLLLQEQERDQHERENRDRVLHSKIDRMANILARMSHLRGGHWE